MNDFIFSPAARQDMLDLWNYIAQDDLDAADRMRDSIYSAIAKLVVLPSMGRLQDELAAQALRVWPVGQYLIIYRPETKPLEVVRVVSGYRDLPALFIE